MTESTKYRCGKHGFYLPDFERMFDGHLCPRILCEQCEEESQDPDMDKRPKNIPYYYDGEEAVVLQEAHNLSAVWKFDPPVVTHKWHFGEDLKPVIAEDALTDEETMQKMEELLPEIEKIARKRGILLPEDMKSFTVLPGGLSGRDPN